MSIGPVQLIVLGFDRPDARAEIAGEVARLRVTAAVRVIDVLAIHKDAAGDFEATPLSDRADADTPEHGGLIGALVGLAVEGDDRVVRRAADEAHEEDGWDVLDDIPRDTDAALLLVEHRWAVPLRDAIAGAGGYRIGDGFVSPVDLADIGLVTRQEAARLDALQDGVA
jgi:hypothetical protein